jgi:hypothetical protein
LFEPFGLLVFQGQPPAHHARSVDVSSYPI